MPLMYLVYVVHWHLIASHSLVFCWRRYEEHLKTLFFLFLPVASRATSCPSMFVIVRWQLLAFLSTFHLVTMLKGRGSNSGCRRFSLVYSCLQRQSFQTRKLQRLLIRTKEKPAIWGYGAIPKLWAGQGLLRRASRRKSAGSCRGATHEYQYSKQVDA